MDIVEYNGDPYWGFITAVSAKHVVEQLAKITFKNTWLYIICIWWIKIIRWKISSVYSPRPHPHPFFTHCLDDYIKFLY